MKVNRFLVEFFFAQATPPLGVSYQQHCRYQQKGNGDEDARPHKKNLNKGDAWHNGRSKASYAAADLLHTLQPL